MKKKWCEAGVWLVIVGLSTLPLEAQAQVAAPPSKTPASSAPAKAEDENADTIFDEYFDQSFDEVWEGLQAGNKEALDAAIAKAPRDAKAYDKRGDYYLMRNEYDKALADYQQAAKLDPKWMEPHCDMGLLYRDQNNVAKALTEYAKAVALDTGITALLSRADYYNHLGREKEMLADYDVMVRRSPREISSYRERGDYFLKQRQYDKALLDFNQLVALKPKESDFYFRQGQALRALGRTDDAIAAFYKIHEVDPKRDVPVYELGLTYLKSESYDLALENFNKDLAAHDQRVVSYLGRGQAYYGLGKFTAGQNDFDKAIEINKNLRDPNTEFSIENILNFARNTDIAQAYFFRSLILSRRLGLLSKDKDMEPAATDAMEAVELDPKLADEYLKQTLPMIGDDNRKYGAFALLTGVAGMQPKNTRVLLQLAQAQKQTFHTKEAIATYTQVLALEPKSVAALRGRADVIAYSSFPYKPADWLPVVADWKSVLLLSPNDADALANLAFAQYNCEQTADGIATSRQLLKLDATKSYSHILLGVGLAINHDTNGAMAEVKEWITKLSEAEADKAARAIGGAKTHYPMNTALTAIYALIPETEEEEEENENPYFL